MTIMPHNPHRRPVWVVIAALSGALAVALGAWGAHGLESHLADMPELSKRLANWDTAVRYQMFHSLALLVVGTWMGSVDRKLLLNGTCFLFVGGMLLFSGGLYGWVLTDVKWLVHVVPLGGVLLIAGWIALAIGSAGARQRTSTQGIRDDV